MHIDREDTHSNTNASSQLSAMLGVMKYRLSVRVACGRRLRRVRVRKMSRGKWQERKHGTPEWLTNHHKGLRYFLEKGMKKFAGAESAYLDAKANVYRAQPDESTTFFESIQFRLDDKRLSAR